MDMSKFADPEFSYSIWVQRGAGDGWEWALIDEDGVTAVTGAADNRDTALEAALALTGGRAG